jgi:hypothetical protein
MNEIYLTHYCHKNLEPFRSISFYTKKTNEIVSKLSLLPGKAYGRFRNYEWYASQRKETEEWLYKSFIEAGGIPKIYHPIYFVLGNSEYIKSCYGDDVRMYQIRLDEVSENEISFTLNDSMNIHVSGEERKVFTREDLFEYIKEQGSTLQDYIATLDKDHKYIEVQIWNSSYFTKYI